MIHSKDRTRTAAYEAALKAVKEAGMNPEAIAHQAKVSKGYLGARARTASGHSVSSDDSNARTISDETSPFKLG